jgi:hypothetical protein
MKRSMDDLLRDTLRARAADPAAACFDHDTAAAFVDGTLSARARSGAEAHAADCPRCQALLAALVRSTPPPIRRAWWRRPSVAWLVPATVAAAAVVIWINVPDTAAPPPVQAIGNEAPPAESLPVQPPATTLTAAPAQAPIGSAADARSVAIEVPRAREAAAAAKALSRASSEASAGRDNARQGQLSEASPTPAAAAAPARPSTLGGLDTASFRSDLRARVETILVVSPTGISQWRIGNLGEVHHSADGGSTWRTLTTGVSVTLTAGSSPAPSVCWLAGPGGLVLITTDEGQSWRKVPFPVAADLISIRAADHQTAAVVTADGRSFATADGGRSWQP